PLLHPRLTVTLPWPPYLLHLSLHDALPISISGAQGFLNSLPPDTPLDIRTIVPTLTGGTTTDDPIVFTGSGDTMVRMSSGVSGRSEEHTSELQSRENLVCRLLLEKKKNYTL